MNLFRRFLGWLSAEPKEYINPKLPLSLRWKFQLQADSHKCLRCDGSGYVDDSECLKCDGTGFWGSEERKAMIASAEGKGDKHE